MARKKRIVKRAVKRVRRLTSLKKPKKETLDKQPAKAGEIKFYTTQEHKCAGTAREELPSRYNQDRLVLQVRDPWWCHAYWEVKESTIDRIRYDLKEEFSRAKWDLRAYDVSYIIFNGSNSNKFFDIEVNEEANSWYIDTHSPGRSWCVDLGLKLPDGRFITILRSNTVYSPLAGPSWIIDEEWMIPEDIFKRLYGLGWGKGSPFGKAWGKGAIASMASPVRNKDLTGKKGISNGASPVRKSHKK